MNATIQTLLDDPAYWAWFQEWWNADYSVEGCEQKGIDWTLGGRHSGTTDFGGRRWGFGRQPPHDLNRQPNPNFLFPSEDSWSDYATSLLLSDAHVQIDGAWLERFSLINVYGSGKLSGAKAFVLGNFQVDSSRIEFRIRGAFVGGATHLINLELTGPSALTDCHLVGSVIVRRTSDHCLHLNKSTICGDVQLSEPTKKIDLCYSQIGGDVSWTRAIARLDARHAVIRGSMRFAGGEGRSELVHFGNARIDGTVDLDHPQADEIKLNRAVIAGAFTCRHGSIGSFHAPHLRIGGTNFISDTTFNQISLFGAQFEERTQFDRVGATNLTLEQACCKAEIRIEGWFTHLNANSLRCFREAKFDGSVISQTARFSRADFCAPATFQGVGFSGRASFLKATFRAGVDFSAKVNGEDDRDAFGAVSFQATRFLAVPGSHTCATFDGRRFNGLTTFDGSVFRGVPRFYEVEFHEDVSIRYARFERAPRRDWRQYLTEFKRHKTLPIAIRATLNTWNKTQQQYENGYRSLKMRMSEVGAARDEQRFLALELRARRMRFDPEVQPLESSISLLYDFTSLYGESIVRPLVATAALVAAATCLNYQGTPVEVGWAQAFDFALQQVFRPFSVWSDKGDTILAAEHSGLDALFGPVGEDIRATPWLKLVASIQSLGCLTLLFLSALAIRRRFRMT